MANVEYTDGNLRLGKPSYKKPRWDIINNSNFDEIAKLGQDDETSGASLVAIPSDIQVLFGNNITLKAVLQYIYNYYMHMNSNNVYDKFNVAGLGLQGAITMPFIARNDIKVRQCVYLNESNTLPPALYPRVGISNTADTTTLPPLGLALADTDAGDIVDVIVLGSLQSDLWKWKLPADTNVKEHKYVLVNNEGYLTQWGDGHEPEAISIVGYVMSEDKVFIRPEMTWSKFS